LLRVKRCYAYRQQHSLRVFTFLLVDTVTFVQTLKALIVIVVPFFGARGRKMQADFGNAEVLSKMRYVTSTIIFQLHAVGGLAMMTQKSMRLRGHLRRVLEMLGVLKELNAQCVADTGSAMLSGSDIKFDSVTVETPTGNELVSDLTFTVVRNQNLIITGPNGSGKSSIFRCLGGLWRLKRGTITKPNGSGAAGLCGDVFYLPQKPYNVIGDLRDQLMHVFSLPPTPPPPIDKTVTDQLIYVGIAVSLEAVLAVEV
jgi:ATP-binding cassette subfamily D (ALD) protein 3